MPMDGGTARGATPRTSPAACPAERACCASSPPLVLSPAGGLPAPAPRPVPPSPALFALMPPRWAPGAVAVRPRPRPRWALSTRRHRCYWARSLASSLLPTQVVRRAATCYPACQEGSPRLELQGKGAAPRASPPFRNAPLAAGHQSSPVPAESQRRRGDRLRRCPRSYTRQCPAEGRGDVSSCLHRTTSPGASGAAPSTL
jgi:hypothetical protein